MNIKDILKKKIIKEVLTVYKADWSVLIYDKLAGEIMVDLFTKSELNDYSISEAFLITANKPEWDFPAVYFIAGTNENYCIINKEFSNKTFSRCYVVIIDEIDPKDYLNSLIKTAVIPCNIKVLENRLFISEFSNCVTAMEFLLDSKFTIFKMPMVKETLVYNSVEGSEDVYDFLVLDRSFDLYTPLVHFFTFKSILTEIYPRTEQFDDGSKLYKEVEYRHIADVNNILQYNVNKLNQNLEQLNKNLSTSELSKMVLDAPENIKLKDSIEKYSNYLRDAFTKLDYLQASVSEDPNFCSLIESELILCTGRKDDKKIQIDMSSLFDLLATTRLHSPDKMRLLYLIKYRGVSLTITERNILKQSGFSAEDIDLKLDLSNKYPREKENTYKYDVSRFEPFLADIVGDALVGDFKSFLVKANNLEASNKEKEKYFSLRKSSMLTVKKHNNNRRKLVVYIRNGITPEECRLAYDLSDALGVDLILGSDKLLNLGDIIPIIKVCYRKQDPNQQ